VSIKQRRKRRNKIESVPPGKFVEQLGEKVGVGMEVEPYGDRWEWRTFYTFGGHRSLMGYALAGWRRPSPYEIRGRTRDQGKAWDMAREAADDARAMFAEEQIRYSRKHGEHVPL